MWAFYLDYYVRKRFDFNEITPQLMLMYDMAWKAVDKSRPIEDRELFLVCLLETRSMFHIRDFFSNIRINGNFGYHAVVSLLSSSMSEVIGRVQMLRTEQVQDKKKSDELQIEVDAMKKEVESYKAETREGLGQLSPASFVADCYKFDEIVHEIEKGITWELAKSTKKPVVHDLVSEDEFDEDDDFGDEEEEDYVEEREED
eukprot:TRINITY_DN9577_c0_g1_i1.p1 TRINITY_DN9577_c0_g1~~TRINITY_DN9577_c0_g1_i1.p1  ORF type:complete len:201 (+),score=45.31 TRINITY_DN9577_c0_g1_i1:541-1143(+)